MIQHTFLGESKASNVHHPALSVSYRHWVPSCLLYDDHRVEPQHIYPLVIASECSRCAAKVISRHGPNQAEAQYLRQEPCTLVVHVHRPANRLFLEYMLVSSPAPSRQTNSIKLSTALVTGAQTSHNLLANGMQLCVSSLPFMICALR